MFNIRKLLKGLALITLSASVSTSFAQDELRGKTLFVTVDPTTPPFATLDDDYRTPIGLDVDIIMELQDRLGFSLKENRIFPLMGADQFDRVKDHNLDIVAGCLSKTKAREDFMDFTPVYYDTGLSFMYKDGKYSGAKTISDLSNATVAVVTDTVAIPFVKKRMPNSQLKEYSSFMQAIIALSKGEVDVLAYDKPIIDYFAYTLPDFHFDVLDREYEKEYCQIALGLVKDSPYRDVISREIENMVEDGTMNRLMARYKRH